MNVVAESMEPTLYEGDLIAINTLENEPNEGSLFLVAHDGEILVRRLMRDLGTWWMTCDNPKQNRFPRKVCDKEHTQIIGRAVYRQTERLD